MQNEEVVEVVADLENFEIRKYLKKFLEFFRAECEEIKLQATPNQAGTSGVFRVNYGKQLVFKYQTSNMPLP